MNAFKPLITIIFALLVLDAIWIAGFMQGLYEQEIPFMLKAEPNLLAALIFYAGYPLGAYWLAVKPALADGAARTAIINGAVLGAVAYGTFAVTNLAVLTGWTATLTIVDTIWGGFVTAVLSAAGYRVAR
jgi:uncharacterized membrane protein